MNVLIVGLGSIGLKHYDIIKKLKPEAKFYALRSRTESIQVNGIENIFKKDNLHKYDFDFAVISSPSYLHLDDILNIINLDIPIFVEKPIVTNLDQLNIIENINKEKYIHVAYNLRFHPLINFIKEYIQNNQFKINEVNSYCGSYLPNWRPQKDYKKIYSANKSLGGGVHLDLIHEPDYIIYLFGLPSSSSCSYRKISNLDIDSIDYANIQFEYEEFSAQIILNYFRKDTKRTLEIITENDSLMVDFVENNIYSVNQKGIIFSSNEDLMSVSYVKQMEYFLNMITDKKLFQSNLDTAIQTMKYLL